VVCRKLAKKLYRLICNFTAQGYLIQPDSDNKLLQLQKTIILRDALRSLFPVTKICPDGNTISKYNNLWLWNKYDFPANAALNIHPQRWNNNPFAWTKELLLQNVKNVVKLGLLKGK
jgi:hypothetical protein